LKWLYKIVKGWEKIVMRDEKGPPARGR
jgi:hypothetical protein